MTGPHPIAEMPTPVLGLDLDAGSKTTQFMAAELRKVEASGRSPTQDDALAAYRKWDDYRDARLMRRVKIAAGSITTLGAAIFGVWVMFGGDDVRPSDVQESVQAVGKSATSIEARIEQNATAAKINAENNETMAGMLVEGQELQVESIQFIGDKIEAAHPRQAEALAEVDRKKPQALKDAERDVDARKRKAKAGELLKKLPPVPEAE